MSILHFHARREGEATSRSAWRAKPLAIPALWRVEKLRCDVGAPFPTLPTLMPITSDPLIASNSLSDV